MVKSIIYEGLEKKNFFRNEAALNLWLRLNAEHIRFFNKVVNGIDREDLGAIDKPYTPYWVSNNQLTYDEYKCDAPRFTLEELSSLSHEEILVICERRTKQVFYEMFGEYQK